MPFDSMVQGVAVCCPRCQVPFLPRRKDQKYCGKPCAKAASRNVTRGPRMVAESAEAARIHEFRKGRLRGLSHALHETPPAYRAAFLQRLIAEGRGNSELRRLVTVRALLRSWVRDEGTGRLHIAHVLDHFCREVYGLRSFQVLNPNTILPPVEALCFPATYYGPDAPPVYEDGALKERPCPWMDRKKSLHHYKGTDHKDHRWDQGVQRDGGFDMHHVSVLP
ncbi:hypothetical protein D1012_07390 [Pseudotabrizicola alkalilacus]|uniref:Uncharacterized protein n=1 Tax=Pseudotabrizicola alkalilacus TaxID=2305252 RepID=A0A411Z3T6_9RHOB|nr:hypothetical protein D1012_07390 [Pseudotabrizicola alkalilacus]